MKKKIDEKAKAPAAAPSNRIMLKVKFRKTDSRWEGESEDGKNVQVVCEARNGPTSGYVYVDGDLVYMVGAGQPERVINLMKSFGRKYAIEEA